MTPINPPPLDRKSDSTRDSIISFVALVLYRCILPFLVGGLTFTIGFGNHKLMVELKSEVAALKKILKPGITEGETTLAGGLVPLPPQQTTAKVPPKKNEHP